MVGLLVMRCDTLLFVGFGWSGRRIWGCNVMWAAAVGDEVRSNAFSRGEVRLHLANWPLVFVSK
jgi:hypothetical protein